MLRCQLLILCCCPLFVWAQAFQLSNEQMPASLTTGATMDVESADLDGDGDLELVLAGEALANLVFFNDGSGNFATDPERLLPELNPNDPYPGEDSEDVAIADFDQDGDPDLLFVSEDTPGHELLLNDGNGKFTFCEYQFATSVANAVAVFDINQDNYPDVIIGNNGPNQLYINDTNGGFTNETASRWPNNSDQTQDLKLADLDNDGDLDIIEGAEVGWSNIYINNNGIFTEDNQRLPSFNQLMETRKVTVGDLNGDNHPDLYFANVGWNPAINGKDRLLINDGNGFFEDVTDTNMPSVVLTTLEAIFMDVNQDGHPDIITTNFVEPSQQAYKVFINDGEANFSLASNAIFPNNTYTQGVGLHPADFNGDGFIDVYFANYNQTDRLFFFIPPTAISETKLQVEMINISPNPTKDRLSVELPAAGNVWITDAKGQLVYVHLFKDAAFELTTKDWPAGRYQLVWEGKGIQASSIFIKH